MSISTILAEIREINAAMNAPGADLDVLRAKKRQLQQEINDTMSNVQVTHTPVVDDRLQAYCDSLLSNFDEEGSVAYRRFASDLRDAAGTVYQESVHDRLVKYYGPTFGTDRVSEAYRKVTAGV